MSAVQQIPTAILTARAWADGELRYRLRKHQKPIYDDIRAQLWGIGDGGSYANPNRKQRRYILKCHRRFGKSALCAFIVCELALRKPGARMYWAAETGKQVTKIILPNMRMALKDCPDELRPIWKASEGMFAWPNGSELHLAGCEDEAKADRLRGDGADLFVLDEAGSIDPLQYVYRSIALWMCADRDGVILMPSSPAKTPAHPFRAYCLLAEAGEGGYAKRTVYDSEWPQHLIDELAQECGGEDTADFRREALAEDVVDEARAIVPEASQYREQLEVEWPRPSHFDVYAGMDIGDSPSLTAAIYGYYDMEAAKLIIEGESELARPRTDEIAKAVQDSERELWAEHFAHMRESLPYREDLHSVYARVSDNEPILLRDLAVEHDLIFSKAVKDDKEAAIGKVRRWVKQGRIKINPRCKKLLAHLEAGIWNKQRTQFEYLDGFGHFDFVDALIYLVRAIDESRNPFPPEDHNKGRDYFVRPQHRKGSEGEQMKKVFRRRRR